MTNELRVMIDDAISEIENAEELADVIIQLSKAPASVAALLNGYRNSVIEAEKRWQEIEARADYRYSRRADAREDFLRRHFSK